LKPQNVLFTNWDFDHVKLIDLGVSNKLDKTRDHTTAAQGGTIRYMPKEQLEGSLSFKTDIWGFGCLMLHFATGLRPFDNLEQELAAGIQVSTGKSPLDHAL